MLILDLKTLPDPAAGKRLLALERFGDAETLLAMRTLRVAAQGHAAVPPHLCRVVTAALVRLDDQGLSVQCFDGCAGEDEALRALEAAVAAAGEPVWVWDAAHGGRALLLARALAHGLILPTLLAGNGPYGLSAHHGFAQLPLHELAAVHGLPHRLGLAAEDVEACTVSGRDRLRAGCEADALNTLLLHLALEAAAGRVPSAELSARRQQVATWLVSRDEPHWQAFRQHWKPA
jgi:hypothetical protein